MGQVHTIKTQTINNLENRMMEVNEAIVFAEQLFRGGADVSKQLFRLNQQKDKINRLLESLRG